MVKAFVLCTVQVLLLNDVCSPFSAAWKAPQVVLAGLDW
jgi:hypothetical protein